MIFPPRTRLARHTALLLVLMVAIVCCGCPSAEDRFDALVPSSNSGPSSVPPVLSFAEQVRAVRRGKATEIESDEVLGDEEFKLLQGLKNLESLKLENAVDVTDESGEVLGQLTSLRYLKLRGSPIGDMSGQFIAKLHSLKFLNLPHSQLSVIGMQTIRDLKLEMVRVGSNRFDDQAIVEVARYPELRFLHLINCPVTDKGLRELHHADQLESLYLDNTQVTDEGLKLLLEHQPRLHIHLNQAHVDWDPNADSHSHESDKPEETQPSETQPSETQPSETHSDEANSDETRSK